MPHINDLSVNNIFEGNNGEKWQVMEGINDQKEIWVKLVKLHVEEIITPLEGGDKHEL